MKGALWHLAENILAEFSSLDDFAKSSKGRSPNHHDGQSVRPFQNVHILAVSAVKRGPERDQTD